MVSISRRASAVLFAAALACSPAASLTVLAITQAGNDSYTTAEDTQLNVADPANHLDNLLANDTVDSGTACVASMDLSALTGSVDVAGQPDGTFIYTPPTNWYGQTTFAYDLGTIDSQTLDCTTIGAAPATVTITVTPVNDAPIAASDSFAALADRTLTVAAPGVLGNDSDVDGDSLSAALATGPAHGVLTLASNGGFSYSPNNGFRGSDAFSYRASDGEAQSGIRVVNLTVTALPPPPTPTPAPTATPEPAASPEPSPSESPLPSDSGLPSPSPTAAPAASASPTPGPITGPVGDAGGPPLLAIGALVVLIGLLAVAGVFFVRSQRADGDEAYETGAYGGGPDDELEPEDFPGDFSDTGPRA